MHNKTRNTLIIKILCVYAKIESKILTEYCYKYNNNNRIELKAYHRSNGSLNHKIIYKYDYKGNKIEESKYNYRGDYLEENLISKTTYKYDYKGNKIEENYYSYRRGLDGNLANKTTYKYDNKGNEIEINEYSYYGGDNLEGNLLTKTTYKYDNKGNKIEENMDHRGPYSLKYIFTYKYEFDERHNWIRKTKLSVYERDTYREIVYKREIEYYN